MNFFPATGRDPEKWWKLEERIRHDKKSPGVIVEIRKSGALWQLLHLLADDVIRPEDLNEVSYDLRERVLYLYKNHIVDDESEESVLADDYPNKHSGL